MRSGPLAGREVPFDVPLDDLVGPLDRGDREAILAGIEGVSSAANLQPWHVQVLDADAVAAAAAHALDALGRPTPNHRGRALRDVPWVLVVSMDVGRAKARFGERGAHLFGVQDVAVACSELRRAAWRRGVASHWVREMAWGAVGETLGLSPRRRPQALLAFGRPAPGAALEPPPSLRWRDVVDATGGEV
ncbi:MAG: nitroreductase family protein [Trueperaceae bacterium]|nr:nitroreductase family protein [Trueperaceae bacterium]